MCSPLEVVECHWQPSRGLRWLWGSCLLTVLGALAGSDFSLEWQAVSLLLLFAYALWSWHYTLAFTNPDCPRALRLDASGCYLLQAGQWQRVRVQATSLVLPWLVVLHYRAEGHWFSRTLCLPADSLDVDTHRRLRVCLRFGHYTAGE